MRAKAVAKARYADPVKGPVIKDRRILRESRPEVRDRIRLYDRKRFQIRKHKEYERHNARMKSDPAFRLRRYISQTIWRALRESGGSKRGLSIMKFLPYTMEELRAYIESLWEPWMNWDNHGPWNENTITWQLDHIIPQASLPFSSMNDANFLKCWALSNLRPLESLKNIHKGCRL